MISYSHDLSLVKLVFEIILLLQKNLKLYLYKIDSKFTFTFKNIFVFINYLVLTSTLPFQKKIKSYKRKLK